MKPLPVGLALIVAVFGGLAGATQPKINAELSQRLGSDLVTALVSFGVGMVVLAILTAFRPTTRTALRTAWSADTPRWTYFSGISGAMAVTTGIITVPTLGVALFSVVLYAGSVLTSSLVDRWGLGPGGRRALTWRRGAAAILAVGAVVISQIGRDFETVQGGEIAMLFAVMFAGALTAFQSAAGGRLGQAVGDRLTATVINFSGGTVVLIAVVLGGVLAGKVPQPHVPTEPWLYVGGPLGVIFVTSSFIAVITLGVLRVTLAVLAGQLVGGIVIDVLVTDGVGVRPAVMVGVMAIFAAVMLSGQDGRMTRGEVGERR